MNFQHKWSEKKAVDQQLSQLNDEIEQLREEKRRINSQVSGVTPHARNFIRAGFIIDPFFMSEV